jgi:hypothetical protein
MKKEQVSVLMKEQVNQHCLIRRGLWLLANEWKKLL